MLGQTRVYRLIRPWPTTRYCHCCISLVEPDSDSVGLQLGLDLGVLEQIASISPGDNELCFSNVFTLWKSQSSRSHPYTWLTVVQALQSPAVGESKLANKVMSELSSHPFTTGGVKCELLTQSTYVVSFPSTLVMTVI